MVVRDLELKLSAGCNKVAPDNPILRYIYIYMYIFEQMITFALSFMWPDKLRLKRIMCMCGQKSCIILPFAKLRAVRAKGRDGIRYST